MKRPIFALAAFAVLAACGKSPEPPKAPELGVSDAVIRLAAVEGRPGVAYFTLHGGKATDRLVAVSSAKVATIELHESRMEGGMMSMRPLTGIDVIAGGAVVFKPGGNHAMLFGVDPGVKPGATLPLHFTFQSGAAVDVEARTIAAGEDVPMHEGH